MKLVNIVLPNQGRDQRFDLEISQNKIQSKTLTSSPCSLPPKLLLPALCHPHIHIDKAYLLTSHPKPTQNGDYPDYSDLSLESGDFSEALSKTAQAKTRYTVPDLVLRGSQLIVESIQAGVTSMRAFVEVDHVTGDKCLDAAVKLKKKFGHLCYLQICAFAQDPIMSTEHGEQNRQLMEHALQKYQDFIEVLGTTPYVEEDPSYGIQNIDWAIETAMKKNLHLDFHLDYNLKPEMQSLMWEALRLLKEKSWAERASSDKRIVFGHCTKLTTFTKMEIQKLVTEIADLPVAFVGLPTSDLFMMGRPEEDAKEPSRRERGTLQVIDMIQSNKLQACISINNVGNAFTPWGSADPLRLASLGVGLYHAGTAQHARILYECVSTRARRAIGLQQQRRNKDPESATDFDLEDSDNGGILMIMNQEKFQCEGLDDMFLARQRLTITDVVWDPPDMKLRHVIRDD